MLLYFEAITKIQQNSHSPLTTEQIVRGSLKAFMKSLDPFSDYFSPEEYATFQRSQATHYAGVGMIISPTAEGEFACIPYPNGPAAKAGIAMDDVLVAIDDVNITGESSLRVGLRIRGEAGTTVRLRVKNQAGKELEIPVVREPVKAQSVLVEQREAMPMVRILSFTTTTRREILSTWEAFETSDPVVLDLRGNPGGSLYDAIDVAMLFLQEGQIVSQIETGGKVKVYKRELPEAPFTNPLYIWQDQRTASAAEVFIAALQDANRAVTIGTRTFGKGVIQQVIPLADRSALYLTTGRLQTPSGEVYHGQGLKPLFQLAQAKPRLQDYTKQVLALLKEPDKPREPPDSEIPARQPSPSQPPISSPDSPPAGPSPLLCFDKDYPTIDGAHLWAAAVQASINHVYHYYTLQRDRGNAAIYLVCLGPFETLDQAEQHRLKLSNAMQTKMFIAQQSQPHTPATQLSPLGLPTPKLNSEILQE